MAMELPTALPVMARSAGSVHAHPPQDTLHTAARQLEGQFVHMLIKSMREASIGDALFAGENKLFHELYDQQIADRITQGKGVGIAAQILKQLQGTSGVSASPRPHVLPAPAAATPRPVTQPADKHAIARTPEQFVASIWQHAQRAARELGINVRALIAQAALETGWGQHGIRHHDGRNSHNLFGIKASGWTGEQVNVRTREYRHGKAQSETAPFRSYASVAESFADYVRLLKHNPRYRKVLQAGQNVQAFAERLQQAGYATDPDYAEKIRAIANGDTLKRAITALKSMR